MRQIDSRCRLQFHDDASSDDQVNSLAGDCHSLVVHEDGIFVLERNSSRGELKAEGLVINALNESRTQVLRISDGV